MEVEEPLLILSNNFNQFQCGAHWLRDNGYIKERRPIDIRTLWQLRGIRNKKLYIMDDVRLTEQEHAELDYMLQRGRLTIIDMRDIRNPQNLEFELTERKKRNV